MVSVSTAAVVPSASPLKRLRPSRAQVAAAARGTVRLGGGWLQGRPEQVQQLPPTVGSSDGTAATAKPSPAS